VRAGGRKAALRAPGCNAQLKGRRIPSSPLHKLLAAEPRAVAKRLGGSSDYAFYGIKFEHAYYTVAMAQQPSSVYVPKSAKFAFVAGYPAGSPSAPPPPAPNDGVGGGDEPDRERRVERDDAARGRRAAVVRGEEGGERQDLGDDGGGADRDHEDERRTAQAVAQLGGDHLARL
jgi:hypothetical protein